MSDMKSKNSASHDDEQSLANLLKLAGERAEIPLGVESRVHHRVQDEWRASVAPPNAAKVYRKVHKTWKRGTRWGAVLRMAVPMGIAASAVLAVIFMSQPTPAPSAVTATVSRAVGHGPAGQQYPAGTQLHAGDTISTGPNEGLSLVLARSESLRIDSNTRLRVEAKDRFTLLGGRIYADSGQFVYRDGGLIIDTDFGSVTDVGTQFSVATDGVCLDVAVREGRVNIESSSDEYVALMGERLTLVQGEGAVVATIKAHDQYWDWVGELTPELDMTHKSLLEFLSWAARETGRKLDFETDQVRMSAMRTTVIAPISGLTPEEALRAVLQTTTVRYSIEADKIVIKR